MIADLILKEITRAPGLFAERGSGLSDPVPASAGTLSGGESQRIRLATQIGSSLMGVLYILDEPSIGLHQRDNDKLIATLKTSARSGQHRSSWSSTTRTPCCAADYIVDIGPGAGRARRRSGLRRHGGGDHGLRALGDRRSISAARKQIPVPETPPPGQRQVLSTVKGAAENNLKNIDVSIPLGHLHLPSPASPARASPR